MIEHQDTISELTARTQELQIEVNCLNDSRDFEDAESVRSGLSHVASQPALLPPYRDPGGMLSRLGRLLSRNDKPPDIWGQRMVYRETFLVNPHASSLSPYPQGFNPWISDVTEDITACNDCERENPDTTLDPRCQTGPPARNSFDPKEEKIFKGSWGRPTKTADLGSSY